MSNQRIKENLRKICKKNQNILNNFSIESISNEIINDLRTTPIMGDSKDVESYYDQTIEALENSKQSIELISIIENIKKEEIENDNILLDFIGDLKKTFIGKNNFEFKTNSKCQIVFFEYDYEPEFNAYGYGKGNYKTIYKPKNFDFNYNEEVFYGISTLNFYEVWKNKINLEEIIEKLEFDAFYDTKYYESVSEFYKYKTFYLLHKAIDVIGIEMFSNIPIEESIFIYANEHDCEPISIYTFNNKKNLKGFVKNFFTN